MRERQDYSFDYQDNELEIRSEGIDTLAAGQKGTRVSSTPIQVLSNPFGQSLAPTFNDPIGVLRVCHGRIEQRLLGLERVCEILQEGDPTNGREASQTLSSIVGYFTSGGIKHTEDEEISLFPRMRPHLSVRDEAMTALVLLEAQHREGEAYVKELAEVVALLTRQPLQFPTAEIARLESIALRFGAHYRPHIQIENEFVFSRALEVLNDAELKLIGDEMARRRGVEITK